MPTPVPVLVPRTDWNPSYLSLHPAFAPLAPVASRFVSLSSWPAPSDWNPLLADLALSSASGAPLRFVDAPPRRRARAPLDVSSLYEARIHTRGEVPSRARSWHDFFNMLCWATFPRAKAALSARQDAALRAWIPPGARGLPGARTREQDTLAMLDEGGALALCTPAHEASVSAAVARGDTDALLRLVRERHLRVVLFGHAMYEHLVCEHPTVRAMPVTLALPALPVALPELVRDADALLASRLREGHFSAPEGHPGVLLVDALFTATRTDPPPPGGGLPPAATP